MEQSGTPTQESPIQPQECGERSAQLIPYPFYSSDGEYAGVQFTTDKGRIIANGTLTSGLMYYLWRTAKFQAGTYTMSVKGKHSGATIYFRDTTHNVSVAYIYGAQEGNRSVTFTVTEEISALVYIKANSGLIDFDCTIMLNAGEEALPFEPTSGYKIPISSAGQTTPIYLGEAETTRRIRKLVFDGTESWQAGTENFYRIIDSFGEGIPYSSVICTHAQHSTINDNGKALFIKISDFSPISSVTDFKAYLSAQYAAGTPVTVWYVLATETTGIVNEPLMKIDDYADTLNMEQAGVSIPTLNGQTVIDVDTTLKPSEVYIKYQG
jgi:hypothetical protein